MSNYDILIAFLKKKSDFLPKKEFKCLLFVMDFLATTPINKADAIRVGSQKFGVTQKFIREHLKAMKVKSCGERDEWDWIRFRKEYDKKPQDQKTEFDFIYEEIHEKHYPKIRHVNEEDNIELLFAKDMLQSKDMLQQSKKKIKLLEKESFDNFMEKFLMD
jgi:hypothetical protein